MFRKVYRRGTAFSFGGKLYRWWIKRSLHKFGREFRAENIPVIACFSNDFVSNSIFVEGFYEREDLESVAEFLKEQHAAALEGLFVDVGANIGNHSLFFTSYFSQVIAIEPNPRTFRLLEFNTEGSPIRCNNLGVSDKPGEMRIPKLRGDQFRARSIGRRLHGRPWVDSSDRHTRQPAGRRGASFANQG